VPRPRLRCHENQHSRHWANWRRSRSNPNAGARSGPLLAAAFGSADRPAWGFLCFGLHAESGRRAPKIRPTDRDPVFPRSSDRCERSAFRGWPSSRGFCLARRVPRGHDQYRQWMAGRDCARPPEGDSDFCTGGHQRADPLFATNQGAPPVKAGVRIIQQSTLRPSSRGQEPAVSIRSPTSKAKTLGRPRKATSRFGFGRALAHQNGN